MVGEFLSNAPVWLLVFARISGLLGLSAVVLASSGEVRALILIGTIIVVGAVGLKVVFNNQKHKMQATDTAENEEKTPAGAAQASAPEQEDSHEAH